MSDEPMDVSWIQRAIARGDIKAINGVSVDAALLVHIRIEVDNEIFTQEIAFDAIAVRQARLPETFCRSMLAALLGGSIDEVATSIVGAAHRRR